MPFYLELSHGRLSLTQDMDQGWGEDGPVLGPLAYCHITYLNEIRICPVNSIDEVHLTLNDGLVQMNDFYYGCLSVLSEEDYQKHLQEGGTKALCPSKIFVNDDRHCLDVRLLAFYRPQMWVSGGEGELDYPVDIENGTVCFDATEVFLAQENCVIRTFQVNHYDADELAPASLKSIGPDGPFQVDLEVEIEDWLDANGFRGGPSMLTDDDIRTLRIRYSVPNGSDQGDLL